MAKERPIKKKIEDWNLKRDWNKAGGDVNFGIMTTGGMKKRNLKRLKWREKRCKVWSNEKGKNQKKEI